MSHPAYGRGMRPPSARREDSEDPYAWMRDPSPERTDYLRAERADYDARLAALAECTETVLQELHRRTPDALRTVAWDHGPYAYYTVTLPGRELPELRRRTGEVEQALLDLAEFDSPYAATGVLAPSPDDRLLAYSVDLTGAEAFTLRFRDLDAGTDLPVELAPTVASGAWAADGTWFFTVVPDHLNRAHEVWRVQVHTGERYLVHAEADRRFELEVERTRSGRYIRITAASRTTTQCWAIPADDPTSAPIQLTDRVPGVQAYLEHDGEQDRWLALTNADHAEFAVTGSDGLRIAHPAERIHRVLAFTDALVTEQRVDGQGCVRVLDLQADDPNGRVRFELGPDEPGGSIRLGRNADSAAGFVTIVTESFTTPTAWWDVDLRSGERRLRHRREVPGHDPADYVSEVISARGEDGWPVPVVVTRRRGTALNGTAGCLLYGYGSYESVDDPWFDPALLPLLDRGVVFAKAHIRGGGEVSRQQWIDGHLLAKRNTFTDFIAAADRLADSLVDGRRIVGRGMSAGGLLMGAVAFLAPRRWAGLIAEVPFVDVVGSMLDEEIPLTINEWEEWGNPRIPAERAYLESYSPYLNLPAADIRPALLVTGAVHDVRVLVHEPAKWVAALRHGDQIGGHRDSPGARGSVLFRVELEAGSHGGQVARSAALAQEAEIIAWTLAVLGQA